MNKIRFDIRAWLEDINTPYVLGPHKNVASGWLGLSCPFCGDSSTHLGISLVGMFFNCWRCGKKGDVVGLVREIEQCGFNQAKKIIEKYQDYSIQELKEDIKLRNGGEEIRPPEASKEFPELHRQYLINRGFNPEELIEKYDLYSYYNTGDPKWKYRIIIPVYQEGKIVNFTARDVTGKAKSSYHHCSNENAIIPMKKCLYNIDTVRDTAIVVEGVTDVWRMGEGCIATFGIEYTEFQVKKIMEKVKKVFIMYDSEDFAIKKAYQLASNLYLYVKKVDVIELEKGDPGDLTPQEVQSIRRSVFNGVD